MLEKAKALEFAVRERDGQLKEANAYIERLMLSEKALKNRLQKAESASQTLKVDKKAALARIQALQADISTRGQTLDQLSDRLSKTEQEKTAAEHSIQRLQKTHAALSDQFKTEITNREATIKELKEKLSVTLIQDLLFESGHKSITKSGKKALKKIGDVLKQNQTYKIVVAGHSDNMPISKEHRIRFPTNWEFSAARAAAVVRYFQYQIGIDPSRMEAVGHSFYKPVANNDDPENRSKNRRVEIFIMPAK